MTNQADILIQQHKLDIMEKFSSKEMPKTAVEAHFSLEKEHFFVNAVEKEYSYQNAITIDVSNYLKEMLHTGKIKPGGTFIIDARPLK